MKKGYLTLTEQEERELRDELELVLKMNEDYGRMIDELIAEKWQDLRKKQAVEYKYSLAPAIILGVIIILTAIIVLGPLFHKLSAQ